MTGRSSLRKFPLWRPFLLIVFCIAIIVFSVPIYADSQSSNGLISFTGKSEFVAVTLPTTEAEYHWSLTGAYICRARDLTPPQNDLLDVGQKADPRLCIGPHGKSDRVPISLPDDVSLSVVGDTTLEVSIADPPYRVTDEAFAQGKVPNHILIIKKAEPLETSNCSANVDGVAVISNRYSSLDLWEDAEIHIPVSEKTVMPFVGKVAVGQPNSSNAPDQLRTGAVAVYRQVNDWLGIHLGTTGAQLVRETSLFSGDVVRFKDGSCLAKTSGFLKAGEDDQGGFISIVASMQAKDGRATIERATPGSGGGVGQIDVQLQFADAVLSHPYTILLGFVISLFVLLKEGTEYVLDGVDRSAGKEQVGADGTATSQNQWGQTGLTYRLTYSKSPLPRTPPLDTDGP